MLPYFFLAVLSPLIHCSPLLPFSSGSAVCSVAWDPAPLSFFITSGASPSCLCSPNYSSLTWLYKAEFPETGKPLYPSHLISSPCDPLTAMQQRKNTRGWCGWTRLRNIGEPEFNPWIRKIPWSRKWELTPVFLPGKSCGQKRLAGDNPWGHKESNTTECLTHTYQPLPGTVFPASSLLPTLSLSASGNLLCQAKRLV